MSFSRKCLAATFTLASRQFGSIGKSGSAGNSLTVSGLRMSARIATAGGDDAGTMMLTIYGMTLSYMNSLTVLPFALTAVSQNNVTLMAGENGNADQVVFTGTIQFAAVDASATPETCFRVQATAGQLEAVKPVPALSQPGTQDVAALFGTIAQSMGRSLENSGVSLKIRNPYLSGTAKQQASQLARAAGIQWCLEGSVLAIWQAGQPRQGNAVVISADNGMVGYPVFSASGLIVTTLFQNTLSFGCKVTVQSILQPACGDYFVYYAEYALDAQMPKGKWFATLSLGKINVGDNASN